jgi:hypothetical protein
MNKSLVSLVAALGCSSPVPVKHVEWSPLVQENFAWGYALSESADIENAWCLYGHQSGDTLYVTRAEYPVVLTANQHNIVFSCGDSKDFLGRAHSHIQRYVGDACYPSGIDVDGVLKADDSLLAVVCKDKFWYGVREAGRSPRDSS